MTKITQTLAAALLCLAPVAPVLAADTLTLPQGCQAYVTTQLSNCQISHHYTCASDPEGHQWVTYVDGEGAFFTSQIDFETRWIKSFDHDDGIWSFLNPDAPDHASFSDLADKGYDDMDFSTTNEAGETRHFRGYDRLTGKSLVIDGVQFDQTEFDLSAFSDEGDFLWRRKGIQMISRDWRLFFSDDETFENSAGDVFEVSDTPMEFVFPEEPGFLSMTPAFGCDLLVADTDDLIVPAAGLQSGKDPATFLSGGH